MTAKRQHNNQHFQQAEPADVMPSLARHHLQRTVWLVALVWSSIILAALWGTFLADPHVRSPGVVLGLGLLWVAGMSAIILGGYRLLRVYARSETENGEQFIYRLITKQTKAAIGLVGPTGRFSLVNESFCQIFGRSEKEIVGQKLLRFVHPEDHQLVREQLRLRRQGLSSTYQLRIVRKNGEVRWILAAVAPVYDQTGRYCGGMGLVTDITEQKQAEIALRDHTARLEQLVRELEEARQQAQAALRAKDQFLASVTHELRTPLTAILGYAETLLIEGDLNRAPPTRIAAIQTILRNGQYLLQIINDLLELAKSEAGRLEINAQDCSLVELAEDVMQLMEIRARAKNLPLRLEIRGCVPRRIRIDPIRVRQILINLLGNAIKFTDSGSVRLVVQVPRSDDGQCSLQFEVIDTGVGIPAEMCEKIFEPFHRGDASTNARFPGTGLGLAFSRSLARCLGGDITVVSEVGLGSNFRVTIPLGSADQFEWVDPAELRREAKAKENASPESTKGGSRGCRIRARVLLAEDAIETRRLFQHILQSAGVEVSTAETGRDAVRKALENHVEGKPFDCILLDINLPDLEGYQVVRLLRESGYIAPVIALTAGTEPGERERCFMAGCDDFATKPLDRCTLLKLVAKYARQVSGIPCEYGRTTGDTCFLAAQVGARLPGAEVAQQQESVVSDNSSANRLQ
ncbi:MAG: PAS domain S-box protein [Thermogutta sp.]|uniref:PAS domain-containing sensor histidine kinase n=1 Tax=Thermogutta sp. TaxID=1962930 RepID=UPI0019BCE99E|nr:ATP-binding protein [Thermogutta sp.]MBC7351583.1 PAS domain S-box protein [Thermogutta sp.]